MPPDEQRTSLPDRSDAHAKWCPRKGQPANMSGGYCSTCGKRVS